MLCISPITKLFQFLRNAKNFHWTLSILIDLNNIEPAHENVCHLEFQIPFRVRCEKLFRILFCKKKLEIWIRNESTHKTDRNSPTQENEWARRRRRRDEWRRDSSVMKIHMRKAIQKWADWMVNITFVARNLIKWNDENAERNGSI